MGYVSTIDVEKAAVVREGSKVLDLMKFLTDNGVTCPDMIASAIEGETNFVERIEALLKADGELDAKIKSLVDYNKVMNGRSAAFKKAKAEIREALDEAFRRAGQARMNTAFGTVYTKANALGVRVVDETLIPSRFFKYVLDETAVKDAARDIAERRSALAATFVEGEEVGLVLALWDFDMENPPIVGVEVDDAVSYSVQVRRG